VYGNLVRKAVGWILRDPTIRLDFERRAYRLGESLDLVVEIISNRDMHISEGILDLLHECRYVESNRIMVPDHTANRMYFRGSMAGRQPMKIMVPKRVTETFQDRFLHSSVDFLDKIELSEKESKKFNARIDIQPDTPPHYGEGETKWILEVVLVLPNGREVRKEEEVLISLL